MPLPRVPFPFLQALCLAHNMRLDVRYYRFFPCFEDESLRNALYMPLGNVCCERALKFRQCELH